MAKFVVYSEGDKILRKCFGIIVLGQNDVEIIMQVHMSNQLIKMISIVPRRISNRHSQLIKLIY